ncbi:TrkA C-terminal domain-containing protein [Kushneria marisflavi]|uniref:RCK C-terminal domain-containing protein n=1 Tax=Kushneria marisflavi TaxID=157779 RepID=A0A240ULF8_9GAMM|nr:TrkA C-terminal domain-containing protein [Kushneria marisflavi]ART61913.1 hypothetical protein B9H00_01555 [Kushneria marisflavi]
MISLGDGQYVIEVEITRALVEHQGKGGIMHLHDNESARLVAIKRDDKLDCSPDNNADLKAGDHVILIGDLDALKRFDVKA